MGKDDVNAPGEEPGQLVRGAPQAGLAPHELHLLNEVLERRYGLSFPEHKRDILASRLRPRLHELGVATFGDYCRILKRNPHDELEHMATLATNNETYFFRERHQFDALFGDGIGALLDRAATPDGVRILCAGSSSGEEAYTLNFYAKDRPHRLWGRQVVIDAFDIDVVRIDIAMRAEYRERSVREMSSAEVTRYLQPVPPNGYAVRAAYRDGVRFAPGNIVDLATFRRPIAYDTVFCRNVLIYFSAGALVRAVENFAAVLRIGGVLFLGHSESIIGSFPQFEAFRIGNSIAYRRVPA